MYNSTFFSSKFISIVILPTTITSNTNMSSQAARSKAQGSPNTPTPIRKQQQSATTNKTPGRKRKTTDENELEPDIHNNNPAASRKKPKAHTKAKSTSALDGSRRTNRAADEEEPAAQGDRSVDDSRIAEEFAVVQGQHILEC